MWTGIFSFASDRVSPRLGISSMLTLDGSLGEITATGYAAVIAGPAGAHQLAACVREVFSEQPSILDVYRAQRATRPQP
jgi:hypothetical protein